VDSNPQLHGCPPNFFVQLETADNQALIYSSTFHDGRGPDDNGTKSTTEYGLSPEMHVCRRGFAMAGIHESQNDLWCAN